MTLTIILKFGRKKITAKSEPEHINTFSKIEFFLYINYNDDIEGWGCSSPDFSLNVVKQPT